MNQTGSQPCESASWGFSWQSGLRMLIVAAIMGAIPLWFVVMSVREEAQRTAARSQGMDIDFPPSPDFVTGLIAIVLQCTGLFINRVSKAGRSQPFYLLAASIPVLFGFLSTWQEYRQLDPFIISAGRSLSAEWIARQHNEFWTHSYFGFAAGALILLLGIISSTGKNPRSCAPCDLKLAVQRGRFQFTLRTALIVMTAVAVDFSAASYCERPVQAGCLFAMVGASLLTAICGGEYGCGYSVILLGLGFGGICALEPHQPHPATLVGLLVSLVFVALLRFAVRGKRNPRN